MVFQRREPAAIGVKARFPGFVEPALGTSNECRRANAGSMN
jgi:bifunctional non-homologous end joining protein LigD